MMLSLLEVLHQLPAPRGDYHTNYGRPAGPQQCWSAVCPACKRGFSTPPVLPTAIIHCINEKVRLLYTESHRTTAQEHVTEKSL